MIERLGCFSNDHKGDEHANIRLAMELCESENQAGIKKIVDGLSCKDKNVANDCIKVLYEVGYRKPELIAAYVKEFIALLSSKNNRLVWGALIGLKTIATLKADEIYSDKEEIIAAYQKGGTITIDNAISVLAILASKNERYEKELLPLLIEHLTTCAIKDLPQRAERVALCITGDSRDLFIAAIDGRIADLNPAQSSRIKKIMQHCRELT